MKMSQFSGIGRDMNIANKYFRLYLRDRMAPYGLNTAEGTVLLSMLEKSGGTQQQIFDSIHSQVTDGNTQDELIGRLHYDKGVMTRTMRSLEDKGFVERRDNPADSRSHIFSLTGKGEKMRGTLIDVLREWNGVMLEGIPEETLAVLEQALSTIAGNSARFFREKSLPGSKKGIHD